MRNGLELLLCARARSRHDRNKSWPDSTRLDSPLRETIVASFIDSRYLFSTPFDDSVRLSQTRTFALLMINNTLSPIRGVGGGRDLESYYFYASYQLGYYIAPLPPDPTTTTADDDCRRPRAMSK